MIDGWINAVRAYHREIGREATAMSWGKETGASAYHREIGREATAAQLVAGNDVEAYHREIGREATALFNAGLLG